MMNTKTLLKRHLPLFVIVGLCASCSTLDKTDTPLIEPTVVTESDTLETSQVTPEGTVEDEAPPGIPIVVAE